MRTQKDDAQVYEDGGQRREKRDRPHKIPSSSFQVSLLYESSSKKRVALSGGCIQPCAFSNLFQSFGMIAAVPERNAEIVMRFRILRTQFCGFLQVLDGALQIA